jgi:diacylglycerol kinase family enzyme
VRGLLVVNPFATTTSDRVRDVLVRALASEVDLEVVTTTHKGHAGELGERATAERLDVVITLGGDGTINEAVNGMLGHGPGAHVPALATVPGGSANVLVRGAGLPKDPVEATGVILEGLRDWRVRTISLGRANDRWFTMNAGMGLDAEIIAAMEGLREQGKQATPTRYLATTLRQYFARTDRKHPQITLSRPGADDLDHVFMCVVLNSSPWTFMGDLALRPCPDADFDTGLDFFAIRDLRIHQTLRWARRLLMGSRAGSVDGLEVGHDLAEFTLTASQPLPVQVDGEGIGTAERLHLANVPGALRIVV